MRIIKIAAGIITCCALFCMANRALPVSLFKPQASQKQSAGPVALFKYDGNINNTAGASIKGDVTGEAAFSEGLEGKAISIKPNEKFTYMTIDRKNLPFSNEQDYSVQCWIKTTMDSAKPFVILAQKEYIDNSLASQKKAGWVIYSYGGTWAWTIGSGGRRVTHENENGQHMPLNDGKWHQLTMTHSSANAVVRLYYDGINKASYKVSDKSTRGGNVGFDFSSKSPLIVGWNGQSGIDTQKEIYPGIVAGADLLQKLVDEFNGFGLSELKTNELLDLISNSDRLLARKIEEKAALLQEAERIAFLKSMEDVDLSQVESLASDLMRNPYTVHQSRSFMEVAPLLKLYSLAGKKVVINQRAARKYTQETRLCPPDFDMDNLAIWDRALSPAEVKNSYARHFKPDAPVLKRKVTELIASVWNIEHGGKHFTMEEHGWDSRIVIAEMLKKEKADVIMMQETYSSGDFIAAELGYYFAASVDWDYLNQGANISVLSRYPIKELYIPETSPFQNVGVKVAISETQDLYVMSNWYGMDQFTNVFEFHQERFEETDSIPVLFAGDFNAVPHTDGGSSPASQALLGSGFKDAYRSLYPDVEKYPGPSHRGGRRIDQLYYKGRGLKNTAMKVISTGSPGFPSDHYLLVGQFELNYSTIGRGKY